MRGTVVSVYASTHQSSQEEKDEFYTYLQSVINSVTKDVLMIMEDFNTGV